MCWLCQLSVGAHRAHRIPKVKGEGGLPHTVTPTPWVKSCHIAQDGITKSPSSFITLQSPVRWCHPSLCSSITLSSPVTSFLSPSDLSFNSFPPSPFFPYLFSEKRGTVSFCWANDDKPGIIVGLSYWRFLVKNRLCQWRLAFPVIHLNPFFWLCPYVKW